MQIWQIGLFIFIVMQRIGELIIARNNEKKMKEQGAIELGQDHYKWFVIAHSSFFFFLLAEVVIKNESAIGFKPILFAIFVSLQVMRVWCISTLGPFWNTKIIILPKAALVKKGPYRWVKHPNYMIVGLELVVIPLLFNAFVTAIVFPIIHLVLLRFRIPIEEEGLAIATSKN